MKISSTLSFSQGLPTPIIRSYHKDNEYITLSLSPHEITEAELPAFMESAWDSMMPDLNSAFNSFLSSQPSPTASSDSASLSQPSSAAPSGGVPTPTPEVPLFAHTSISIINPHSHLTLSDILHIIYLNAIDITTPELAALADTYAITDYDTLVPILIRARYTADDEFAIQRKAILGDLSEFTPYNEYVESCKSLALSVFP